MSIVSNGAFDVTKASYTGMRHHTDTWDRLFGLAGGAGGISANTGGFESAESSISVQAVVITTGQDLSITPSVTSRIGYIRVFFNCTGGNATLTINTPPVHMSEVNVEMADRTFRDTGAVILKFGSTDDHTTNLFFPGDIAKFSIDPTGFYYLQGPRSYLEFFPIYESGQVIPSPGDANSDMRTEYGALTVVPAPTSEGSFALQIVPEEVTENITPVIVGAMDVPSGIIAFITSVPVSEDQYNGRTLTVVSGAGADNGLTATVTDTLVAGANVNLILAFDQTLPDLSNFVVGTTAITVSTTSYRGNLFVRFPLHVGAGIISVSAEVMINAATGWPSGSEPFVPPTGTTSTVPPTGFSLMLKQSIGDVAVTEFRYTPSTNLRFYFNADLGSGPASVYRQLVAKDGYCLFSWVISLDDGIGTASVNGEVVARFYLDHFSTGTTTVGTVDRMIVQSIEGGWVHVRNQTFMFKPQTSTDVVAPAF